MMIRGGGHPKHRMVSTPFSRMGPPPRSFAADAHDCIMVWIRMDPPNTRVWRDVPRLMARSPRIITQKPWSRRGTIGKNGRWVCGRSAAPTVSASPASRASSEGGEMLTFAHIPTGTTVNKAIDIDDSKSRGVAPITAPTMIGADFETGGATP